MKYTQKFAVAFTLLVSLSAIYCKKNSGDDICNSNKAPIVRAGLDFGVIWPQNSATLIGSGSWDPENNISEYSWTRISGPSSLTFADPKIPRAMISDLTLGVYVFSLKVTDKCGLFAIDTVEVYVADTTSCNCNSGAGDWDY